MEKFDSIILAILTWLLGIIDKQNYDGIYNAASSEY